MELNVPFVKDAGAFFDAAAQSLKVHAVACVDWPQQYPYAPDVTFALAHTGESLCLRFFVHENCCGARATTDNGSVWEDSCVEFFIALDDSGYYYNFEFNCIGTMLLGFRKLREECVHAPKEVMDSVWRRSTLGVQPFEPREGDFKWELSAQIPVAAFFKHKIEKLSGMIARANFYKCGDEMPKPHFLSWAPIDSPKPDFHLEKFFGEVKFE